MLQTRILPSLAVGVGVLALVCAASLAIGARPVPLDQVWAALVAFDPSNVDEVVVRTRVGRTASGVVVGIGLAVAGAAMQGATRNPLADPGILGLNSGAATAVALGVSLMRIDSIGQFMGFAFLGAAAAAAIVYGIASVGRSGPTPVRLALTGAAVSAALASVVGALVIVDADARERLRFWQVGTLTVRPLSDVGIAALGVAAGLIVAVGSVRTLNVLALGDDAATGLGTHVARARTILSVAIVLLASSAVALAGPIGFVGLVVPHAARLLVGADYRRLVPLCVVAGPSLLLMADTIGRIVLPPTEVQVAVMTALVGVPVFLALIRSRRQVGL